MIDIRAELDEARRRFISFHDFILKVQSQTSEGLADVCRWILKRIADIQGNLPVNIYTVNAAYKLEFKFQIPDDDLYFIEKKLTTVVKNEKMPVRNDPFNFSDDYFDDEFYDLGFSTEELIPVFPELNLDKYDLKPSVCVDDNPSPIYTDMNTGQIDDINVEWQPRFKDRKSALEIIGVLSLLLVEKSGNKYYHGDNISANSIAEDVARAMSNAKKIKSPESYRKLISNALKISGLAIED